MSLTQRIQLYDELIRERVELARRGVIAPEDEGKILKLEMRTQNVTAIYPDEAFYDERRCLLTGELYARMKTIPPQSLENIVQVVRDPVLDAALIWLSLNGGIENTSEERFVKEFNPLNTAFVGQRRLPTYLRPIVLLELLVQEPDRIPLLEQTSSYFPHRLLFKLEQLKCKQSQQQEKQRIREIEQEIASVLPGIIPDELKGILPKIEDYITENKDEYLQRTGINATWVRVGKYCLSFIGDSRNLFAASKRRFVRRDKSAEDELDNLYFHKKKLIYETLAEVYNIIFDMNGDYSCFFVHAADYDNSKKAIMNYAMNQLTYIWRSTQGKHKHPQTPLSRLLGLMAHTTKDLRVDATEDETLRIDYGDGHGSFFYMGQKYLNTSTYLPLCVSILNELYKKAQRINQK